MNKPSPTSVVTGVGLHRIALFFTAIAGLVCAATEPRTMISLMDNGAAISNPGMGWSYGFNMNSSTTWFHYYKRDDADWIKTKMDPVTGFVPGYDSARQVSTGGKFVFEWFPGCENALVRLGWSYFYDQDKRDHWDPSNPVAPTPNFERVDKALQGWKRKGGKVAICFVVHDPYYLDQSPNFSNVPPWVRKAGARGTWWRAVWTLPSDPGRALDSDPGDVPGADHFSLDRYPWTGMARQFPDADDYWSWTPEYDDPVFLSYFEDFLRAAADHWKDDSSIVHFEIGSLGTWGEGHQFPFNKYAPVPDQRMEIPRQTRLNHLRMWARVFRNPEKRVWPLYAGDELGLDYIGDSTGYSDILDSARALGIGFMDHSIEIPSGHRSPGQAARTWPTLPVLIENNNGKIPTSEYSDAVEQYHASYIRINAPAAWYLNQAGAFVSTVNRRIGYRFNIVNAEWPARYKAGGSVPILLDIRNAGVAPCYAGGYVSVHLFKDGVGPISTAVIREFDVGALQPGPLSSLGPLQRLTAKLHLPITASGSYTLAVSIGDANGIPRYSLPYSRIGEGMYYPLASINVRGANPSEGASGPGLLLR